MEDKEKIRKLFLSVFVFLILVFTFGCAKPPLGEFVDARASLLAAKEAGAMKYIPDEYKKLEDSLNTGQKLLDNKDYDGAFSMFIKVRDEATRLEYNSMKKRMEEVLKETDLMVRVARDSVKKVEEAKRYTKEAVKNIEKIKGTVEKAEGVVLSAKTSAENIAEKVAQDRNAAEKFAKEASAYKNAAEKAAQARVAAKKAALGVKLKEPEQKEAQKTSLAEDYVSRDGDTLWSIAGSKEIYNDNFMWPLIYDANKDVIEDPDLIYPNVKFKIPRKATMSQVIEARKRAGAKEPYTPPTNANIPKEK